SILDNTEINVRIPLNSQDNPMLILMCLVESGLKGCDLFFLSMIYSCDMTTPDIAENAGITDFTMNLSRWKTLFVIMSGSVGGVLQKHLVTPATNMLGIRESP
ncbi:MAG TPA: hypothetical protein VGO47_13145, partial [Chlamydiales bacterium]|nr:hypothetical protein [Chlamydiales bacterium]